jgi:hypothetical protein
MPSRKASFLAVDAPGDARTDARAQLIIWRLRANHWRGIASPAQALQRLKGRRTEGETMRHPYDFNSPPIRTQMRGTVTQREEWWHIRCWLKPRLFAIGVNNKQWHRYKRRLQQYLRDNGYEPTVREAELLLHQLRTEKKKKIT